MPWRTGISSLLAGFQGTGLPRTAPRARALRPRGHTPTSSASALRSAASRDPGSERCRTSRTGPRRRRIARAASGRGAAGGQMAIARESRYRGTRVPPSQRAALRARCATSAVLPGSPDDEHDARLMSGCRRDGPQKRERRLRSTAAITRSSSSGRRRSSGASPCDFRGRRSRLRASAPRSRRRRRLALRPGDGGPGVVESLIAPLPQPASREDRERADPSRSGHRTLLLPQGRRGRRDGALMLG